PLGQCQRSIGRCDREWQNRANVRGCNTKLPEHPGNFRIYRDYAIESTEDESTQGGRARCPACRRARVAAGVECEHRTPSRQHRAEDCKREQTRSEVAAEVKMQDIGFQSPKQAHQIGCGIRVEYTVGIFLTMPRKIDCRALVTDFAQQVANRDEIGLYP